MVQDEVTSAQSWTPTVELDPEQSPYHWGVVGRGTEDHPSPLYGTGSFTYEEPTGGVVPLKANPPVYGDSNARFPSLSWQPIDGADFYRLRVFNAAGFELAESTTDVLDVDLAHPSVTDWGTHFVTHPGTYTFGVYAFDETESGIVLLGTTSVANRGTFTIGALPAVTGQQLALDGKAIDDGQTCDLSTTRLDEAATTVDRSRRPRCSTGNRSTEPAATWSTSSRSPTSPTRSTTLRSRRPRTPAGPRTRPSRARWPRTARTRPTSGSCDRACPSSLSPAAAPTPSP